jgi:dephospho-CoA kinase
MKVIGITGGIGSGKSLVATILKEKYGAYILDTDGIARKQMEPGGICYQGVVDYFGSEIVSKDGTIDRKKLAEIAFEDRDRLRKLNELTHPKVLKAVNEAIRAVREEGSVRYIVVETALMIESGYDNICDEVWYIHTPEEERRNRLKEQRSYSDEKISSIFERQSKTEAFRAKFPKVIENIGDRKLLEQQIEKMLEN